MIENYDAHNGNCDDDDSQDRSVEYGYEDNDDDKCQYVT
jgi:hypothetical protein